MERGLWEDPCRRIKKQPDRSIWKDYDERNPYVCQETCKTDQNCTNIHQKKPVKDCTGLQTCFKKRPIQMKIDLSKGPIYSRENCKRDQYIFKVKNQPMERLKETCQDTLHTCNKLQQTATVPHCNCIILQLQRIAWLAEGFGRSISMLQCVNICVLTCCSVLHCVAVC